MSNINEIIQLIQKMLDQTKGYFTVKHHSKETLAYYEGKYNAFKLCIELIEEIMKNKNKELLK